MIFFFAKIDTSPFFENPVRPRTGRNGDCLSFSVWFRKLSHSLDLRNMRNCCCLRCACALFISITCIDCTWHFVFAHLHWLARIGRVSVNECVFMFVCQDVEINILDIFLLFHNVRVVMWIHVYFCIQMCGFGEQCYRRWFRQGEKQAKPIRINNGIYYILNSDLFSISLV